MSAYPWTPPTACPCCAGNAIALTSDLCLRCGDALMVGHAPHPGIHPASATQRYAWTTYHHEPQSQDHSYGQTRG